MTDQPEQTAKDGDTQPDDPQERLATDRDRDHEPDRARMTDQRQFSDFALI